VTTLIVARPCLIADTGPFCRFAQGTANQLDAFADYLGDSVWIVQEVAVELAKRSRKPGYERLVQLGWRNPSFPQHPPIAIADRRMITQIDNIIGGRQRGGRGPLVKDRGEVASVLVARDKKWPVLMDDGWGRHSFAPSRGVETISTEDLCLEMAHAGALSADDAYEVFESVYHTSRATFDRRLGQL
jgi:hypothetical protein